MTSRMHCKSSAQFKTHFFLMLTYTSKLVNSLDLLSFVELEKKTADLKGELENALKENTLLQKQVNELSKFQSLPNTAEIQQKEVNKKNLTFSMFLYCI